MMPAPFGSASGVSLLPTVVAFGLFAVLVGASARAEAPAPDGLTAAEFLARVEKTHPGLPTLEAAVEEATAGVTSAGLAQPRAMQNGTAIVRMPFGRIRRGAIHRTRSVWIIDTLPFRILAFWLPDSRRWRMWLRSRRRR